MVTAQDARDALGSIGVFAAPAQGLVQATWNVEAVQSGVEHLAKGMTVFMNTLDEVSRLHPFISVAVLTFKAVYMLEMKRRENDKRVVALFLDMKDMMGVLRSLKGVDVQRVAADGTSVESRLLTLCQSTDTDMRDCSNTCDTFMHKKIVIKVLNAPVWNLRLADFAKRFATRRKEFEFALTIHSAVGIDLANRKLLDIESTNREAKEKMDRILAAFEKLLPPEEKAFQAKVQKEGGVETALEEDKILETLLKDKSATKDSDPTPNMPGNIKAVRTTYTLTNLKQELAEDINTVLERNMETFERKFDVQRRQIEELKNVVIRDGDRVIAAVTKGAHDRIIDPDLHKIWEEMQWRGNVKTRHFIVALRDYFLEKSEAQKAAIQAGTAEAEVDTSDDWVLDFLDIKYLQPISEAFDDDASGFITVAEANKFSSSRPDDWSLLRWIGYWAIGSNMTMKKHRERMLEIMSEMFSLFPILHPDNKKHAALYLTVVWERLVTIAHSFEPWGDFAELTEKFQSYEDSELERIKTNLEGVKYDIDDMGTLALITGPGRIEKNFFPLARLLLENDLLKFHIARDHVLHESELKDSFGSLLFANDAMRNRLTDLTNKSNFSPQPVDMKQKLKSFAYGVFEYLNDNSIIWGSKNVKQIEYDDPTYDASQPPPEYDVKKTLLYDLAEPLTMNTSEYETSELYDPGEEPEDADVSKRILGPWTCCVYDQSIEDYVYRGLVRVEFTKVDPAESLKLPADAAVANNVTVSTHTEREIKAVVGGDQSTPSAEVSGPLAEDVKPTAETSSLNAVSVVEKKAEIEKHENQFRYKGFSNMGTPCEYNGWWKQDEAGKIIVSWVVAYDNYLDEHWVGEYNPSSNVIVGTWGYESEVEEHTGRFLFTRLTSEVMINRPTLSAFDSNRSRALWQFAIRATLHDVRRRRCSWGFMKERRDVRKAYVEQALRYHYVGRPMDNDEVEPFCKLRQTLRVADTRYYMSLVTFKERQCVHQWFSCDVCGGRLMTFRLACLDCDSTAEAFSAIDLCGHPRCLTEEATREDLATPHIPTHNLMKIRPIMTMRTFGRYYRMSIEAVKKAKDIFKSLEEHEAPSAELTKEPLSPLSPLAITPPDTTTLAKKHPTCLKCGKVVERPCWYCAECPEDVFICWDCDGAEGVTKGTHTPQHALVTCLPDHDDDEAVTVENRLDSLAASVDSRMTLLESRLSSVDARLDKLETMLKTYFEGQGNSRMNGSAQ